MAISIASSSNPTLSEERFSQYRAASFPGQAMTLQGAVNKTAILLVISFLSAGYVWKTFFDAPKESIGMVTSLMIFGAIVGFVVAMVTVFKNSWSPITAPLYALLQGLLLGGISALTEAQYPGIAIQAVGLTFAVSVTMLAAYSSGVIKVTERFQLGVIAATGGIAIFYLVSMVLGFFGVQAPLIFDNSWMGIGFSVFVVIIAALNLVLDFDMIRVLSTNGAPKFMEWYAAFGLMVTLVWLYLEILRLLTKLRSSR
jgi:uncharacterized YccA/Bax inhibitor family protein